MKKTVAIHILPDDVVQIEGKSFTETGEIGIALREIFDRDPELSFLIDPRAEVYYKGVGMVIYGSQREALPIENFLFKTEEGEIVTFAELGNRRPAGD